MSYRHHEVKQAGFVEPHSISTIGWVMVGDGLGWVWLVVGWGWVGDGLGLCWGWVGQAQPTCPRVSTLKISTFPKRFYNPSGRVGGRVGGRLGGSLTI